MSDTPETDAKAHSIFGNHSCATVLADFARKLERERDDTMKVLTIIHHWIERNSPDGFIDSLSFTENLERITDRWYDRLDMVERERDEARKKIKLQAERIRELEGATNHAGGLYK